MDIILFVICVLVVVIFIIIMTKCNNTQDKIRYVENMQYKTQENKEDGKIKWMRSPSCKYKLDKTTEDVFKALNIEATKNQSDADLILPCGYNNINEEINTLPNVYGIKNKETTPKKRVFIIEGADEITAKNYLWKNLFNQYGLKKACELSPTTYLLTEPQRSADIIRLEENHTPGKLYILKKNIQRQTGLEIVDNIDIIKNNPKGYVLAQDLLEDSYLVNGRKINLRVYIIVVCHKNNKHVYMFDDGFMYYTKQPFVKGDKSPDNHITTGYVDRDVYHKNPLTHTDFKKYLDLNEGDKYHESNNPRVLSQIENDIRYRRNDISDVVFERIQKLIHDVFMSFKNVICRCKDDYDNLIPICNDYSVQIFGADVAINENLHPQIIEINKGPDLSPKDERDGRIKHKMFSDTLEIIGIKPLTPENGFIHILSM